MAGSKKAATAQPEQKTAVISPQSAKILADLDLFLKSPEVTSLEIHNAEGAEALTRLGNEVLQKKHRETDALRKKEAKVWDDGKAAVQAEFMPRLKYIKERQNLIAQAVVKFRADQRLAIEAAMREAEAQADKERKELESKMDNAIKRAELFLKEAAQLMEDAANTTDEKEKNVLIAKSNRKRQWAEHWQRQAENKAAESEAVTPAAMPVAQQAPIKPTGGRFKMKATVKSVKLAEFLPWVLKTERWEMVAATTTNIEKYIENNNGEVEVPGIEFEYAEKMGWTGRFSTY